MSGEMAFGLAAGALGVAMVVSAVRMALDDLSPGALRKLETTQPALASTFTLWYNRRDRYRISLRMLHVTTVVLVVLFGSFWLTESMRNAELGMPAIVRVILAATLYFLGSEFLGCGLGNAWSRQLLRVGLPLARLLAAPFWFVAWLIERWQASMARTHLAGETDDGKPTTEDEIMSLVENDARGDGSPVSLEEDERRMIRGIFDLDETLVREIMTPRVDLDAISERASLAEVRQLIVESGHSRIPVYRDSVDHIVGVLHAKDLLAIAGAFETAELSHLVHAAIFIPESKNVGDLLGEFQENITHFAVVVDEYGGTAGVVTLEDILEEIVGEIRDEYDRDEDEPVSQKNGANEVVVDARTSIYDINDLLDVEIPDDEDFDTLGGYLSYIVGYIPKGGQVIKTDELEVEVLAADERRILKARVRKLSPAEGFDEAESRKADDET